MLERPEFEQLQKGNGAFDFFRYLRSGGAVE